MKAKAYMALWLKFRPLILGSLNGAVYATVQRAIVWQSQNFAYKRNLEDAAVYGHLPVQLTSNIRWPSVVIAWILLFAVVAWVLDRLWRDHINNSIIFWELVGLIAITSWNVFLFSAFWIEKESSVLAMSYKWATSSSDPIFGPFSLGMILIVNLIYGGAIWLFERTTAVRTG